MESKSPASCRRRIILAGLIGNVMEWYDFAVYGYFAAIIGRQFFPSDNPAVSLITAFGAFAAGFLVRPLGGLLFGRIGDLIGRTRALTLSVITMAVPTVLIGLLPTHAEIGLAAPVLLVAFRMIQGLSVGGEYTSSLVFLVENSPHNRRAFSAIWGVWGAGAGILLGSGVGALLTNGLDEAQVVSWGWRLPFVLGALVAGTGYFVRRNIHTERPVGETKSPVLDSFGKHRSSVLRVALLNVGYGISFYAAFVYAVTYIKEIDHLPEGVAFNLNTLSMALLLLFLPMGAWLSDRIGRKPILIAAGTLMTFGAIPLFHLIHTTHPITIFLGELGFALIIGMLAGGIVAANVELIPAPVRCTGLAFAYNVSIGVFGGTTPLMAAWLISTTGNPIMPAYWIVMGGAVTLLTAIFLIRETAFIKFD
ncbi:MAG: MFS transporter [Nitrospira sp.]|nr:MFS transporter [Nitrospira sp.]MCA9457305.1 MFS transporter [Nitrospira sp.]